MVYLMFADTVCGEFHHYVRADDDDSAVSGMKLWLRDNFDIDSHGIYSIAGVWNKDPKFHTAIRMSDLDEQS